MGDQNLNSLRRYFKKPRHHMWDALKKLITEKQIALLYYLQKVMQWLIGLLFPTIGNALSDEDGSILLFQPTQT